MSDTAANTQTSTPLSEVERVVDTFVAPSKTFNDILRSSSWWLPWLLGALVPLGFSVAIQQKVGWDKTYSNILRQSSQTQQDRIAQLPPDQQVGIVRLLWSGMVLVVSYCPDWFVGDAEMWQRVCCDGS